MIVTYSVPFEEYDDSIVDDLCAHKWVNEAHVDGDAEDRIFAVYAHYVVPRGGKVASELPMERFPNIEIVNGDVARPALPSIPYCSMRKIPRPNNTSLALLSLMMSKAPASSASGSA